MNFYLGDRPSDSLAILRIQEALQEYRPAAVNILPSPDEADAMIIFAIGRNEHVSEQIELWKAKDKKIVLMQLALRSTRNPDTADWIPLWEKVDMVWSYYDLQQWAIDDGHKTAFHFYHSPLGAGKEFRPRRRNKDYTVCTTGSTFVAESLHEVWTAAGNAGVEVEHVGKVFDYYPAVTYIPPSGNKARLAGWFNQTLYVSGLRRKEGFELPAAGGASCGAIPLLYDQPHYRQWFDGLATFIQEGTPDQVIDELTTLFKKPRVRLTDVQMRDAWSRFNWETILKEFWERL